jgi:hypothetical protein
MRRLHAINEGKNTVRTPYVSIDIETTGIDPEFSQILEIGAIVDDWVTPVTLLPKFHCYVFHNRIIGSAFALQMNAAILRKIADAEILMEKTDHCFHPEHGLFLRPKTVGGELAQWLMDQGMDPTKPILAAGKNFAGFDRPFLQNIPGWNIPFFRRVIDPAMLYWLPDIDPVPPSTETCMERAGIPGGVAHTAVEDAMAVVRMVRASRDNF